MKSYDFKNRKKLRKKITFLTCYDYPSACIAAESKLDGLLVGDSVAMAVHGHPTTISATMEMMILHTESVARGLGSQFLITDMPFLSYRGSLPQTIHNVQRLLQAGAQAVKLEGGDSDVCQTIAYLTEAGVPVIGHIGLTPQFIHALGGYRVQGKTSEQATLLLTQAEHLEQAGCIAIVLECIPSHLAKRISEHLSIPTIGIGSGKHTDGQVLVWHDIFGLQTEVKPKFIKQYLALHQDMLNAINQFHNEVQSQVFPADIHSYS